MSRLKIAAQFTVDTLLLLMPPFRDPSRVLIVRLDGIGDIVLWLDAAQATVNFYKRQGKTVVLIANAQWADWTAKLGIFDEVVALDRRKFNDSLMYRLGFLYTIRRSGYAIAVNPTYSREWLYGDAVIRVSGARDRIGSTGDLSNIVSWQRRISDRGYTRLISADPSPLMELVRNAEFVRGLGVVDYLAKVADLHSMSALKPDEAFSAANATKQPYYVFFPGSAVRGKRWSPACFAELADLIYRHTGWHGVVCGGPEDVDISRALCAQTDAVLLDWAGKTDLAQLSAILSNAHLVVANDTSATHIAAACGVPSVCILGGGHYGRFLPYQVEQADERPLPCEIIHRMPCYGCGFRCVYGMSESHPYPCIDRVTVPEVWRAVAEELDGRLKKLNAAGKAVEVLV